MRRLLLLIAITILLAMPNIAGAQQNIGDSLLRLYAGKDPMVAARTVADANQRIDQVAKTDPNLRRSFMLVFSSDIPIEDFAALCAKHNLDLNSTRFEFPLSTGLMKTIEMREYLAFAGTIEEKVTHRLAEFRELAVQSQAKNAPPTAKAAEARDTVVAIDAGAGIWSSEVVGTYGEVASMRASEPRLLAALDTIKDMTAARDRVKAMPKLPMIPIGIMDNLPHPRVKTDPSSFPRSSLSPKPEPVSLLDRLSARSSEQRRRGRSPRVIAGLRFRAGLTSSALRS